MAADDVRSVEVFDASGTRVGMLLGQPVDLEQGHVAHGKLELAEAVGNDLDAFVEERILSRFAGSFVFLLHYRATERVYLDAGGTMSAVYDPDGRRLASSTPLLLEPDEYRRRFDVELHRHLKIDRDGWFPAGLTAHAGIHRLQCNHYLDLATWRQHRHWPRAQVPIVADPEAASRKAAEATRQAIGALHASGRLAFALTGGNESRLMLAACRDIAPDLEFVTIANPSQALDLDLVEQLVTRFGLKHRFIPRIVATS